MTDAASTSTSSAASFPGCTVTGCFSTMPAAVQTCRGAVDRIAEFLLERNVQIGGTYAVSLAAAEALQAGREAARDLVNAARPDEIVFGPSTTQLMMTLAAAMRGQFEPGDEIVVTRPTTRAISARGSGWRNSASRSASGRSTRDAGASALRIWSR